MEKKLEYNETVHQLFTDFKIAYDSVRREVHIFKIFRVVFSNWQLTDGRA
jgi:hypothetical protein